MSVTALEGGIIDGQVHLEAPLGLPNHTKVYVIIPELTVSSVARIVSPRLVHSNQLADFRKEIVEEPVDAGL